MQYNIVKREDSANIVVVVDGEMYVADEQHPLFDEIVEMVFDGDESVVEMFDTSAAVATVFEGVTERISVAHSKVYVDNDIVTGPYADKIVELIKSGGDALPYANFLEKVYTNTEEHTRDNLARWLNANGSFTIDEDGDIIGYKGVTVSLGSINHGPAVVNGTAVHGSVPNQPGSVVSMARSKVEHNPGVGCASGLHVGTWDYANGFGSVVLEVKVNPRDVVSVPTDCSDQKMRVSRYKVNKVVDYKHREAVIPNGFQPSEDFFDDYEDSYDDYSDEAGYPDYGF